MRDDATVYSSVTLTNVMGDNISNGTGQALVSEVRGLSKGKGGANWCYLFIHHTKVNAVNEKLKERYCTFIHKSVVYKRKTNVSQKMRSQLYPVSFLYREKVMTYNPSCVKTFLVCIW